MILCITHSQDFYTVDLFFEYLNSKNIPYFRLNTDHLNHLQKISADHHSFSVTDENGTAVHSSQFLAVWHRKSWPLTVPEDLNIDYRNIFFNEYQNLRNNLFTILDHLPWINPYEAEKKIDANKMYQLQMALEQHLKVPATLFSNDAKEILKFFKEKCNGKAVAKLHGATEKNMSGENMISTVIIDEANLEYLADMVYCPMIFQPYIDKEYELRIVYTDGEFFTGKINNSTQTDWRIPQKHYFWSAYHLPVDIKDRLAAMMQKMGLLFGAIDMIRSTDGNYYFLEVNPQGEWGMLQKELGFPIAEKIADSLLQRINKYEQ